MRSILIALVLAAPLSAVAATPTYSNPMTVVHHYRQQEQMVPLRFINHTSQEREVRIGNKQYILRLNTEFQTFVPVGCVVRVYSSQNSKVNGQALLQVSAADANRSVVLQ